MFAIVSLFALVYSVPEGTSFADKSYDMSEDELKKSIDRQADKVQKSMNERMMKGGGDDISIRDMFEMQMSMNKLSQYSEMSTGIVSSR